MEPEEKKLLENTYRLAKENNAMLRKVRGVQKRATILSIIYWIFIIGAAVGAFYFAQPYVTKIENIFKSTNSPFSAFTSSTPAK